MLSLQAVEEPWLKVHQRHIRQRASILEGRRDWRRCRFLLRCGVHFRSDHICEFGDRRILENLAGPKGEAILSGRSRDLNAEYGVTAQCEEIVMNTDAL